MRNHAAGSIQVDPGGAAAAAAAPGAAIGPAVDTGAAAATAATTAAALTIASLASVRLTRCKLRKRGSGQQAARRQQIPAGPTQVIDVADLHFITHVEVPLTFVPLVIGSAGQRIGSCGALV